MAMCFLLPTYLKCLLGPEQVCGASPQVPLDYRNIHMLTCGEIDIRIVGVRQILGIGLSPSGYHHFPGLVET